MMFDQLIDIIKKDNKSWGEFQNAFIERTVSAKTIILREGQVPTHIFFIKNGCLRERFNKDGKDITFQFFFEGQAVASMDSFINNKPSIFSIESIEPSLLYAEVV